MSKRRARAAWWLVALAPSAAAHGDHERASATRSVAVDLSGARAHVAYSLAWRGEIADRERLVADRDHDGRVSPSEGAARLDALTAELLGALRCGTGRDLGRALAARAPFAAHDVESATATGWAERGDLVLAWRLGIDLGDAGALCIDDAWARPEVTHGQWVIERGTRALTRAAPPGAAGVATLVSSEGGAPMSIEIEWPAPRATLGRWWIAVGLAALLAALGAAHWRRGARPVKTP